MQVLGNFPILTMCGSGDNTKGVRVRYLIINAQSPYNFIIDRMLFNMLKDALSTVYLTIKYPLEGRRVCVIKDHHGNIGH